MDTVEVKPQMPETNRCPQCGTPLPSGTLNRAASRKQIPISFSKANMVVATGNNAARIAMSVERAAKGLIKGGKVTEGLLNKVEMAFRAYDPCLGCATHSLPDICPCRLTSSTASGTW